MLLRTTPGWFVAAVHVTTLGYLYAMGFCRTTLLR